MLSGAGLIVAQSVLLARSKEAAKLHDRRPLISVVIATRNRARILDLCLRRLAAMRRDCDGFEVLVIDNGSTDETADVITMEKQRERLPLRSVVEPTPGLAVARNTGVRHARGEWLAFLDDDALVSRGWLDGYLRHIRDGGPVMIQGRIEPLFIGWRPAWLHDGLLSRFGRCYHGDEPAPLEGEIHGGNLAVARRVFEDVGLFRRDLGLGATGLGEDTEFGRRAALAGVRALYAPDAMANHLIPRKRTTRGDLLKRCFRSGLSQAAIYDYDDAPWRTLGYFVRSAPAKALAFLAQPDPASQMDVLCEAAEHAGRVAQILRQRRHD